MDENFEKEYHEKKNEALLQVNKYFFCHIEEISQSFRNSLKQACDRIRQMQQKGYQEIEYLEFTMLRTRLLLHDTHFPIMVYGTDWYADINQFQAGDIDGGPIYSFYETMIEAVSKIVKKYQTKLPERCLEQCMCQTAEHFWNYVEMACQWAVKGFSAEGLKVTENFKIRVCEYMGYGRVCWRYTPVMTDEQLRKWFDKREGEVYKYRDYRGRNLSGLSFAGMNLSDCDFRDCNMENCDFQRADLTGAWFCGSNMKNADLTGAWLPGARFDRADLRKAVLEEAYSACEINDDLWLRADNIAASFSGADLREADFTFSSIESADFTGALMEGVLFNDTHEGYYALDKTQAAQVQFGFLDEEDEE